MFVLKTTQCTIKMDLFLFSLFKHKMFLDLERKEHKSTLRGRETFCTAIGARAGGHLGLLMEIRSKAATSSAERSTPADGVEDGGSDGGRESAEVRWRFSHCSSAP